MQHKGVRLRPRRQLRRAAPAKHRRALAKQLRRVLRLRSAVQQAARPEPGPLRQLGLTGPHRPGHLDLGTLEAQLRASPGQGLGPLVLAGAASLLEHDDGIQRGQGGLAELRPAAPGRGPAGPLGRCGARGRCPIAVEDARGVEGHGRRGVAVLASLVHQEAHPEPLLAASQVGDAAHLEAANGGVCEDSLVQGDRVEHLHLPCG
mmetsp:Transcript_21404/g.61961  ORF Transcript_21404/g.61961 Transcript_21404/m.61961 type:complete len:205 (+) Transcript_21404:819-1433(+)